MWQNPGGLSPHGTPPHYAGRHIKGGVFFFSPHTWSNPHEKKYCHIKGGDVAKSRRDSVTLVWQGRRWAETGRQPHWNNKHKL